MVYLINSENDHAQEEDRPPAEPPFPADSSVWSSVGLQSAISTSDLDSVNSQNDTACQRIRYNIAKVIKSISVEPVCLLFVAAYALLNSCGTSAVFNKICHQKFPQLDCFHLEEHESTLVQQEASSWNMYIAIAEIVLTCPATLIWSAYGDYSGRKINMMVAISGYAIYSLAYACAAAFTVFPLWLLTVIIFLTGSTGLQVLFFNACVQYLGDTIKNKETMTVRMAVVLTFTTVGGIIGGFIGSSLLRATNNNFALSILIGQVFLITAQFYVLIVIKHTPPVETENGDSVEAQPNLGFTGIKKVVKEIWVTFSKPRPDNNRTYIIVLLIAFLMFATDLGGANKTMNIFAFQKPLTFSPSRYGMLGAFNGMETFVANIVISGVGKKVLHLRDTTLMLISMGAASVAMLVYGFSTHNWMLWVGGAVNSPSLLGRAGLQSILTSLAEPHERGKLVAGAAIVNSVASLISSVAYPEIYSATVSYYAGAVFFVIAGVVMIGFCLVLWVHVKMWARSSTSEVDVITNGESSCD